MPKYRFRKVYIICERKKVMSKALQSTTIYQYKDYAEKIFKNVDKITSYVWMNQEKPPIKSIEAFYLVHESFFEEVLKEFSKEEPQ